MATSTGPISGCRRTPEPWPRRCGPSCSGPWAGQHVEVGCLGGHGRTGTALACLAVLAGHPAGDAVAWVRSGYCAKAVETPGQEAFIAAF